jgi:hypothetical protein
MVEYNNELLNYYKESLMVIDQHRMDNSMIELDMDHEEDTMVDNNMNPYILEMNNE